MKNVIGVTIHVIICQTHIKQYPEIHFAQPHFQTNTRHYLYLFFLFYVVSLLIHSFLLVLRRLLTQPTHVKPVYLLLLIAVPSMFFSYHLSFASNSLFRVFWDFLCFFCPVVSSTVSLFYWQLVFFFQFMPYSVPASVSTL